MLNDKLLHKIHQRQIVPINLSGKRLDIILSNLFPEFSRSQLQKWLKEKSITVNGEFKKSKDRLIGNEEIILNATLEDKTVWVKEDIKFEIVYEDEYILVINKHKGLVVHPGSGISSGTLANGLLFYNENFSYLPRCGIVHRLDKDTTGLLVIAKRLESYSFLVKQLQNRTVSREYDAICYGNIIYDLKINENIGRSPHNRTKMAVNIFGKEAITNVEVIKNYGNDFTRIKCILETGRTHQIRVHLAHIGKPLLGDHTYGYLRLPKNCSEDFKNLLQKTNNQILHARSLSFIHPQTCENIKFECNLPKYYEEILINLESNYNDIDDSFID